jgi:hypothetical protein
MTEKNETDIAGRRIEGQVSWLSFLDTSDTSALDAGRAALLLALDLDGSITRSNAVLALLASSAASGEPVDRAELQRLVAEFSEFQAQHAQGLRALFDALDRLARGDDR